VPTLVTRSLWHAVARAVSGVWWDGRQAAAASDAHGNLGGVGEGGHQDVVELVRSIGYQRRDEPFRLASGALSRDYVDGKRTIAQGRHLKVVAEAAVAAVKGVPFDAVGGLTMGADALAIGVAMVSDCLWFSVRKEPKGRGLEHWIEGAQLLPAHRVLLVDDVITTGGSTKKAYDRVVETGATVVAVVTLVDRGDAARELFASLGVEYRPLVTYADLGIEPVVAG
jgi:orotate phosphoribosyltransferase